MGARTAETTGSHAAQDQSGDGTAVVLPEALDMRACRGLKKALMAAFSEDQECRIDAGNVRRVSTGCLQVLAAFVIGMEGKARPVRFDGASAEFKRGVELLGLHGTFASCKLE